VSPDLSVVLSALLHAGLLAAAALWTPALEAGAEDGLDRDTLVETRLFQQYLVAPAEPEEDDPAPTPADINPDGHERTLSKCGSYQGGSMGERSAPDTDLRYGVHGPADNPDPHIANRAADRLTFTFDRIGFTPDEGRWGGEPDAPMEPWGREDSLGNESESARGHMWGQELGMSFGSPGAGLGLRRLCPTCGGLGNGDLLLHETSGAAEGGGAIGTERAARPPATSPRSDVAVKWVKP
jgi:hypothetical protein